MLEPDLHRFDEALSRLTARQGWFERSLRIVTRVWCRIVAWRIDVDGVALLPRPDGGLAGAGSVVVAAPHRAWVEPFLLHLAWPPDAARLVWLADGRTVTRSWWRRHLLPRLGVIPIDAGAGGPRAYAELAAKVLAGGHAVVVFPEVGPPSAPDRPRRISPGFAYLALRAGAPLVPVAIGGTHRIVRGASFSVDVLDPIDVGPAMVDPFTADGRAHAHGLAARYDEAITAKLPSRTAQADARAPERERWRWLADLFG